MRQFFGMSQHGNLQEAVAGLSHPQFLMLLSGNGQFEAHVTGCPRLQMYLSRRPVCQ